MCRRLENTYRYDIRVYDWIYSDRTRSLVTRDGTLPHLGRRIQHHAERSHCDLSYGARYMQTGNTRSETVRAPFRAGSWSRRLWIPSSQRGSKGSGPVLRPSRQLTRSHFAILPSRIVISCAHLREIGILQFATASDGHPDSENYACLWVLEWHGDARFR